MTKMYAAASPFPHMVLENVVRPKRLREVKNELDLIPPTSAKWRRADHESQVNKLWIQDVRDMPPKARNLIQDLNAREFLTFLSDLTGLRPLLPDPGLEGGGVHRVLPGGKLDLHADFNLHPKTRFHRRLNVLLYMNALGPREDYGGYLELHSKDGTFVRRLAPSFNRMVVFSITDDAIHGHPEPWNPPDGRVPRDAIAMYYYTVDRPAHEKAPFHWASWKKKV